MKATDRMPDLPCDAGQLVRTVLAGDRRVLLFGPPGVGKSTLLTCLADALGAAGRPCHCLSADPGSPAFGIPGSSSLAKRTPDGWHIDASEALCSLDAGRFRLPLVSAVARLARQAGEGMLLLDGPGVVRGVAGAELLHGLVEAAGVDLVLALSAAQRPLPLAAELALLPAEVQRVVAAADASPPGKHARARARTARWDAYLADATELQLDLNALRLLGTPPPADQGDAWTGRQLALWRDGRALGCGEVLGISDGRLRLRAPAAAMAADTVLLRDAARGPDGLLRTAAPFTADRFAFAPPPEVLPAATDFAGPRIVARVGRVDVALVNGLFGDPLLHVRLRSLPRSLLFDLGDGGRLPARIAHQVSDVFISHAHMDHLGGFLWLLRSRIGDFAPCRLYGPPGLAEHVRGLVEGFLWDRIGAGGPAFEIAELHGDRLLRFALRAGRPGLVPLGEVAAADGLIHREAGFSIRAVTLDHHTPVLAYAYEPRQELSIRKDRLAARGWVPGAWLGELKQRLLAGQRDALLDLPGGGRASVAELADELVLSEPGKRLVYATDLADTPANRERLQGLARHAHTLFLEASFSEADRAHALANGHLTARACGEIASAAGVARLVPFHLSRRYAADPEPLFDELRAACPRVLLPGSGQLQLGETLEQPGDRP